MGTGGLHLAVSVRPGKPIAPTLSHPKTARALAHPGKNWLNILGAVAPISDIKLIRTDTTLDLSLTAEKLTTLFLRLYL